MLEVFGRRAAALLILLPLVLVACGKEAEPPSAAAQGSGASPEPAIAAEVSAAEAALAAELHLAFVKDRRLQAGAVTASVSGNSITLRCEGLCARDGAAAFDIAQAIARKADPAITVAPCSGLAACEGSGEPLLEAEGARDLDALVGSARDLPKPAEPAPGAPAAPLERPATYRIGPGDTLSKIAAKTLGSGNQWEEIYRINRDKIGANPEKLQMGMELRIPQE
jgi:nucleoid-associated protein YgaU